MPEALSYRAPRLAILNNSNLPGKFYMLHLKSSALRAAVFHLAVTFSHLSMLHSSQTGDVFVQNLN